MTDTLSIDAASDLFRAAPDRFVDVGDAEVAVRSVGTGPDVVFVHGFPVSGATFRTLLPRLAERLTCHVIDLPGAGDSRFDDDTDVTFHRHVDSVRRVIDELGLDDVAVVGHDSGGLIARCAVAGDERVRSMGLIDTEQSHGLSWRFRSFLLAAAVPGFGAVFGRICGSRPLRRNGLTLGGAFLDRSMLDGEFDEFFLRPIHEEPRRRRAAAQLVRSFDTGLLDRLPTLHGRLDVPVRLVYGAADPFFPLAWSREMVGEFPDAELVVIDDAALFSHEEQPDRVADALLPILV